ncbi:GNAT family N-acetyltransferase [Candidatus Poribacteria bacterium]|nr:GNAT family N-acetyltransferase [Candidatus Poribacteria bacterium]
MPKLPRKEYGKIRPIFAGIDNNIAHVYAAIEGNSIGKIFVDNVDKPESALIDLGWCFLGGREDNSSFNHELKELFVNKIMPNLDDGNFMIYSFSDEWKNVIDKMLNEYKIIRIIRTVLDLDPELFRERHSGWQERIPKGYRIQRVDNKLAEELPGVDSSWGGIYNFLVKGFGFCVMEDNEVISSCSTVHVGGGRAETAIKTKEGYRRQGFGTLAACAYIQHCLENEILPEWGCFYNKISGNIAEKLGFTNRRDVPVNYVKVEK